MIKKMTNTQLFFLYEGLAKLRNLELKTPVRTSFSIVKNIKTLAKDYEAIEQARTDIVEKYQPLDFDNVELIDKVNKELSELGDIEVEIDISPIKLSDIESLDIPLDIIETIEPIIEE